MSLRREKIPVTLFFYNLALIVALVLGAPWWLTGMVTARKYREGLLARIGFLPTRLKALAAAGEPILWLHAVSVGEVLAVTRLVKEMDQEFRGYRLVISTTTRTGQALARERFGEERVFYCPLDLPWAVRAYLNLLQPRALILTETEFWPNLLASCYRRQIPVVVVNARISDRSYPRYRRLKALWQPFLGRFAAVLAQSEVDAERLRSLGCQPEAVTTAGNLKFDVRSVDEAEATTILRRVAADLRLLVAGSTLEGEEALLLEAWPKLLAKDAKLAMVLAPRHPERFAAVVAQLESSGVRWQRRSGWKGQDGAAIAALSAGEVLLLDTIGGLASVYSIATAAFVGGSLIPAGGHNPLEPAQFALPILMGPHYENFRAIVSDLALHEGILIADRQSLAEALYFLLNEPKAQQMGQRARAVFLSQSGATARCRKALREILAQEMEH